MHGTMSLKFNTYLFPYPIIGYATFLKSVYLRFLLMHFTLISCYCYFVFCVTVLLLLCILRYCVIVTLYFALLCFCYFVFCVTVTLYFALLCYCYFVFCVTVLFCTFYTFSYQSRHLLCCQTVNQ